MWSSDRDFTLLGTEFHATGFKGITSTVDRFFLMKPRALVDQYVALIAELRPQTIFELGIFRGGSTAFLSHLAAPKRLVAVDLTREPVDALEQFIDRYGYGDAVKPYYAIDQADGPALEAIYRREFDETPLDLVLDDASHNLDATRASFNSLFPRLRAGGLYIIEDWGTGLFGFARPHEGPFLASIVFELLCTLPYHDGLIANVVVDKFWATVKRGSQPLPPGAFDLSTCYHDRARRLIGER
jgi:Methyltransferase domain